MKYDIFPKTALEILGALKGKTAEEMAQELLEEEEKAMRKRSEEKEEEWICRRNRLHKRMVEQIKSEDELKG